MPASAVPAGQTEDGGPFLQGSEGLPPMAQGERPASPSLSEGVTWGHLKPCVWTRNKNMEKATKLHFSKCSLVHVRKRCPSKALSHWPHQPVCQDRVPRTACPSPAQPWQELARAGFATSCGPSPTGHRHEPRNSGETLFIFLLIFFISLKTATDISNPITFAIQSISFLV